MADWLRSADVVDAAGDKELMVRINALDTEWGRDDVEVLVELGPRALMVPKVERPADLDTLDVVSRR